MKEKKTYCSRRMGGHGLPQGEPAAKNVADIIADALEQGVPWGCASLMWRGLVHGRPSTLCQRRSGSITAAARNWDKNGRRISRSPESPPALRLRAASHMPIACSRARKTKRRHARHGDPEFKQLETRSPSNGCETVKVESEINSDSDSEQWKSKVNSETGTTNLHERTQNKKSSPSL
jgi:hypothetical protein